MSTKDGKNRTRKAGSKPKKRAEPQKLTVGACGQFYDCQGCKNRKAKEKGNGGLCRSCGPNTGR